MIIIEKIQKSFELHTKSMIESRYWLRNCGRWLSALCSTTSRLTSTISWLHNTIQCQIIS